MPLDRAQTMPNWTLIGPCLDPNWTHMDPYGPQRTVTKSMRYHCRYQCATIAATSALQRSVGPAMATRERGFRLQYCEYCNNCSALQFCLAAYC